ncbi:MAG: 50S ribosomal protein L13, partial [Actinobacteria bacterium]|nr:50S ribosomal protein L13 [Actinomycetota bacterium]
MVSVGSRTFILKKEDVDRKWYLIDAKDRILGRLAVEAAKILRGKDKPSFTPHVDCGDFLIIINAEKIRVKGNNKLEDKKYYRHSGYVGNLKETSLEKMIVKDPE